MLGVERVPWTSVRLQLPICLLLGAALSLIDRTDVNWDLQNYHLYAPFAAVNGRLTLDYFAAGFQGYLNPLADVPNYLARCVLFPHAPRIAALLAGLPYGFLVFLVLRLGRALSDNWWTGLLAATLGLTGATTLSEVGTAYNDILIADAVLLALLCALRGGWHGIAGAGLLGGFAVALKMTAAVFIPPLTLFVLCTAGTQREVRALALLGAMGALGFIAGYGWWGLVLWRQFGNPFFPLLGGVFHSAWALTANFQDRRFFPKSALQWAAYPFFWLQGKTFVVSEEGLRDPRFALAYLAVLASAVRLCLGRLPPRPVLGFWLFCVSAYILWLAGFSILRYALPLEAITGVLICTVLREFLPPKTVLRIMAVLLLASLAVTKPVGWGRLGYAKTMLASPLPQLPANALVFMQGAPIGFVAMDLAQPNNRFINLAILPKTSPEWDTAQERVAAGAPAFLLTNTLKTDAPGIAAELAPLHLKLDDSTCDIVKSPMQRNIRICTLKR